MDSEEDVQHDVYRPYYVDRIVAGLDARGRPVAWSHRIVGSSILAHFLPNAFKNGLDGDAVDGSKQLLYDIPPSASNMCSTRSRCFVRPGGAEWGHPQLLRGRELHRRDRRRVEARPGRLATRAPMEVAPGLAVLNLAARRPDGATRFHRAMVAAFRSCTVDGTPTWRWWRTSRWPASGDIRVRRVVCAVDCGTVVNPDTVVAQIEGGVIYGISGALWGEITVRNGRVEQSNFSDYRVLRNER
jgi:hypothetical protein